MSNASGIRSYRRARRDIRPVFDAGCSSITTLAQLDLAEFFLELFLDVLEKLFPALEETLGLSRWVFRQSIGGEDGKGNRAIHITDHGIGQLAWIELSPTDCFARRSPGGSAGIPGGGGYLDKIVVSFLVEAEHLLDVRFGL